MIIKFKRFLHIFLLLSTQCLSQEKSIKFEHPYDGKKIRYYLQVSDYDTIMPGKVGHAGSKELWILFSDSALVYLSTEFFDGSTLNVANRFHSNVPRKRTGYLDTLRSKGSQSNGLLWREDILAEIVVGYINVPPDKEEHYDKILATLRRKKK